MAEVEEEIQMIFMEFEENLEKGITFFKGELDSVRAGRANPRILDKVLVDYYGVPTPIPHMSNVSVQEGRCLVISPWDASLIKNIRKAISESDIGIMPTDDGRVVRITFPQLTEERRRELVKETRRIAENAKVTCRNARRDALDSLKAMKKDGTVTDDMMAGFEKDIQKTLDSEIAKIDEIMDNKEKEIMQV